MNAVDRRDELERDFAAWDAQSTAALNAAIAKATAHTEAEAAICRGEWPFVCPGCGNTFFANDGHFPYCGALCAIHAELSR